jgi:hypothetical protein
MLHVAATGKAAAVYSFCCPYASAPAAKRPGREPEVAGLQLPSTPWAASVVAEAHLLSGKGDTALWAR